VNVPEKISFLAFFAPFRNTASFSALALVSFLSLSSANAACFLTSSSLAKTPHKAFLSPSLTNCSVCSSNTSLNNPPAVFGPFFTTASGSSSSPTSDELFLFFLFFRFPPELLANFSQLNSPSFALFCRLITTPD